MVGMVTIEAHTYSQSVSGRLGKLLPHFLKFIQPSLILVTHTSLKLEKEGWIIHTHDIVVFGLSVC